MLKRVLSLYSVKNFFFYQKFDVMMLIENNITNIHKPAERKINKYQLEQVEHY